MAVSAGTILLVFIAGPAHQVGLPIFIAGGIGLLVAAAGASRRPIRNGERPFGPAPAIAIFTVVVIGLLLLFITSTWTH